MRWKKLEMKSRIGKVSPPSIETSQTGGLLVSTQVRLVSGCMDRAWQRKDEDEEWGQDQNQEHLG